MDIKICNKVWLKLYRDKTVKFRYKVDGIGWFTTDTLNECGQKWRNIYQRYFDVNNLTTKTIKLSQPPYVKTIIV